MSQTQFAATADEIVDMLERNDFADVRTFHDSDGENSQVSFSVPTLSGVNVPWLSSEMERLGWHVEKVENTGTAQITVKEGTDPYVPE